MNSKPDLLVAPCSYQAAKFAVMKWHYSKSMPTPPVVRFGVWENGAFIGAVLFSRGASNNYGKEFELDMMEVCELTRVALNEHQAPVTKIMSVCISMLKDKEPGLRIIYSYADANHGHMGKIYQAGNWLYAGQTQPINLYKDSAGRVWHSRQVSRTGVKRQYGELRQVPKIADCEKIPQLWKYKYLYPLDRAMRRQIEPLAQPYPKKIDMRLADGSNPAPTGRGGSTPTGAL